MNEWLTVITSSPGPTPERVQGQVQGGRAARDGAGVAGADVGGELLLEGRHLRALRHPPGEDRLPRGGRFLLAQRSAVLIGIIAASTSRIRPPPPAWPHAHAASTPGRRSPSVEGHLGDEAQLVPRPAVSARRRGTGLTFRGRVELGRQVVGAR